MSLEDLQKQWDNMQDKLENDFDKFRLYFQAHKSCKCHIDDCRHFDRALKIFNKRLDELDDLNLKIFGITYQEVIKPILDPDGQIRQV